MYGAPKFHHFIYGRPTVVESYHKPVQYILNWPLHEAPLRQQKMMLNLQRYDLKVKYRPEVELSEADAGFNQRTRELLSTFIPILRTVVLCECSISTSIKYYKDMIHLKSVNKD